MAMAVKITWDLSTVTSCIDLSVRIVILIFSISWARPHAAGSGRKFLTELESVQEKDRERGELWFIHDARASMVCLVCIEEGLGLSRVKEL
jgi:hypothetical protein